MAGAKKVREPIQVYLDRGERAALDRLARELGVSRAEVLRRGLGAMQRRASRSIFDAIEDLARLAEQLPPPAPPEPGSKAAMLLEEHDRKVAEYLRSRS